MEAWEEQNILGPRGRSSGQLGGEQSQREGKGEGGGVQNMK